MSTMRAGLYLGEQEFSIQSMDVPELQDGEALLRISYGGICGTDMMIFAGKHPRARFPLIMGHEFCGTIEEITDSSAFKPGDKVVIEPTLSCGRCEACMSGQFHVCKHLRLLGVDLNGGFAEYAKAPINRLHRIPAELPELTATLCEPLAVAVHCVRRSNLKIADTIAILGCGPIGLLIAQVAKHAGAAHIMMSDISPFRLAKARELGFIALDASSVDVVEEIKNLTDGKGADIVFEVAGTGHTAKQMIEAAKIQAQVMVVSLFKAPPVIDLSLMHFKEISINTTRCYTSFDFQAALHLMASGAIDTSPLISHVVPLERIAEGFELMRNPEEALKILIQP